MSHSFLIILLTLKPTILHFLLKTSDQLLPNQQKYNMIQFRYFHRVLRLHRYQYQLYYIQLILNCLLFILMIHTIGRNQFQ